jgi:hypothetical protein
MLLPLVCSYELGEKSRGTALWVKMKPEYGDQTEDLDMLILGEGKLMLSVVGRIRLGGTGCNFRSFFLV